MKHPQDDTDYTRIFIALLLGSLVLLGWQAFFEWPRRQALSHYTAQQAERRAAQPDTASAAAHKEPEAETNPALTREQRIALSPRISISSADLHGTIALKGARFDDLSLAKYHETIEPTSPEVVLLSPSGTGANFVQIGWLSPDGKTKVPDQDTLWQADKKQLGTDAVRLHWDNGEGVTFLLNIALDDAYMFTVTQHVDNHSGHEINLSPYAYINRAYTEPKQKSAMLFEGPLGVMQGALEEISYKDIHDAGAKAYPNSSGWFGITDKYWLTALIPSDSGFKANFSYYLKNGIDRYQADYLGTAVSVAPGSADEHTVRLFAGAKELSVLNRYRDGDAKNNVPPVPLFDRALDFGHLWLLSEPIFYLLNFFHHLVGNFGIAIMLLTIVVKACLFPLANKAYKSSAQMRALQPEMLKIRERYADDQIALSKATMDMYKREGVHPAAGCLPMVIQMPVFFALYKVLYVTIEMRQAPFFGWLKDLSDPDPSNIFTGFGLIPWATPVWLHLGILPILMCITMILQMKQQPKPADPVQAKVMTVMPYMMLYMFSKFAAGLVLYWTWSNTLSVLQQRLITARHKEWTQRPKKAKASS